MASATPGMTAAEYKAEAARTNAIMRAMRQGFPQTLERPTWDLLHTPEMQSLAAELPLNFPQGIPEFDARHLVAGERDYMWPLDSPGFPALLDPSSRAAAAGGPPPDMREYTASVPPELFPVVTDEQFEQDSSQSSPEEREYVRRSAQYWKALNRARVQRMRRGCPHPQILDNIAGCLAYLRLPMEPMAHLQAAANLTAHASKLCHILTTWYAPKLRWMEAFMFAKLSPDVQHDLMKREEDAARLASGGNARERAAAWFREDRQRQREARRAQREASVVGRRADSERRAYDEEWPDLSDQA